MASKEVLGGSFIPFSSSIHLDIANIFTVKPRGLEDYLHLTKPAYM